MLLFLFLSTSSLIFLLLQHELYLRLGELLSFVLVLFIFNLLLATFNLKHFALIVFVAGVAVLWLLENANLISKLFKIFLLNNLIEMFFGKGELFRVLLIFLLQVLQK